MQIAASVPYLQPELVSPLPNRYTLMTLALAAVRASSPAP